MPKQNFAHITNTLLSCGGNHYFELITYLLSKQASRFIMQNKNNIIFNIILLHTNFVIVNEPLTKGELPFI